MTSIDRKRKREHPPHRGAHLGGHLDLRVRVSIEFAVVAGLVLLLLKFLV